MSNTLDFVEEPPGLDSAKFVYTQEGNTHGTTEEYEELTVEIQGVLGDVENEGGFLVLRTSTGWSINDPSELVELLLRTQDLWAGKKMPLPQTAGQEHVLTDLGRCHSIVDAIGKDHI